MIELPLVFMGGLLGSGHCIGMCGAFALAIGWNANRPAVNLVRQSIYSAGRCFTYVFLGASAGLGGQQLQQSLSTVTLVQGGLSILAGVALLITGLVSAGLIPPADRWLKRASSCGAATHFRNLLQSRQPGNVFLAGLATGFLPCGLVYAFLALALSSGTIFAGAAIMAAFGLGTMPLMLGVGLGSSIVGLNGRKRLVRLAAICVIATGCLTIVRGAGAFTAAPDESPSCPFCAEGDDSVPTESHAH